LPGCGGDGTGSSDLGLEGDVAMELGQVDTDASSTGGQLQCDGIREGVGTEGDWSAEAAEIAPLIREVSPQLTDEGIMLHTSDKAGAPTTHQVYLPDAPIDRLFVFFPGTGSTPQQYELLLSVAGSVGYHVIGLVYANQVSVNGTCKSSEDECACLGNIRMEVLTGTDASTDVAVGAADSVDNRLKKLLRHLDEGAPDEGWSSFVDESGGLKWEKVALGGHSQGGGHVALMAQRHTLARALFFSSPADTCLSGSDKKVADWVDWPLKTPAERLFGLSHLREKGRDNHQLVWDGLGMGAERCIVDVDGSFAPYDGARMLVTAVEPASGACPRSGSCDAAHGATVADVPMDAENRPVLESIWHYMLMYEP